MKKWKFDWISRRSPITPPAISSRSRRIWSWNGKTKASQSGVPVSRATARTCSVPASEAVKGFSHRTGFPARSARIVHSACSAFGSGMYRASTPGSSISR